MIPASLMLAAGLMVLPALDAAQPITADRDAIRIAGMASKTPLSGTLRLVASQEISGFKLLVSDLMNDGDGGPPVHDPIAASAVTVTPALQDGRLGQGVQQFAFQVAVPSETGIWKGAVLILWDKPAAGRIELPIVVTTRSQPTLALATPQQLSFSAASGDSIQFRFQLKETSKSSPTAGVKVTATDLRGTTGTRLLRADNVNAAPQSDIVAVGGLMPVSVTIDLRGVESGKYAGQLMVTDAYHNDITVPVEVSVKDRWPLPLAVLLFGVAVGMTISGYRARGRTRDELIVRIDSIKTQVAQAGRLEAPLRPLVQRILVEVSAHIESKKWEAAKEAAGRAESLIVRWRSEEDAWVTQLARLANLKPKLEGLARATLGLQLTRHLDSLDLTKVASAGAFAQEVDKAEDLVRFYEQVENALNKIGSDVERLSTKATARKLGTELETLRTRLLDLKPNDAQSADALRSDARALEEQARDAQENEEALQTEILALDKATNEMLGELSKPASTSAAKSIAELARRLVSEGEAEPLEGRRQHMQNIWRALWSSQSMLQLVGREPTSEEGKTLLAWLAERDNYQRSPEDFRTDLEKLETRLPDASWPGGVRPRVPNAPRPPGARSKGPSPSDALALELSAFRGQQLGEPTPPPGARQSVLRSVLSRLNPSDATERSRLRLAIFRYGSYALALGLLVWMGFAELYAASGTFGADGTKDYLILFLWGFGAEATRSAVTDVVKGLVPAVE